MKTNIVRIMFCEECLAKNRPHKGDRFVLSHKTGLLVHFLDWNPPFNHLGFTPHLIDEYTVRETKVVLETFCLMEGCGIKIEPSTANNFTIFLRKAKFLALLKNDWIALQSYIDKDYSLL